MSRCPTCGRNAEVLITNLSDSSKFCQRCAPPSFLANFVLTVDDVAFLESSQN